MKDILIYLYLVTLVFVWSTSSALADCPLINSSFHCVMSDGSSSFFLGMVTERDAEGCYRYHMMKTPAELAGGEEIFGPLEGSWVAQPGTSSGLVELDDSAEPIFLPACTPNFIVRKNKPEVPFLDDNSGERFWFEADLKTLRFETYQWMVLKRWTCTSLKPVDLPAQVPLVPAPSSEFATPPLTTIEGPRFEKTRSIWDKKRKQMGFSPMEDENRRQDAAFAQGVYLRHLMVKGNRAYQDLSVLVGKPASEIQRAFNGEILLEPKTAEEICLFLGGSLTQLRTTQAPRSEFSAANGKRTRGVRRSFAPR